MNDKSIHSYNRPQLCLPPSANGKQVVLHSCCAPCVGEVLLAIVASDITPIVYFYNPNIHPEAEYKMRKQDSQSFCDQHAIEHIDADYDVDNWFAHVQDMGDEPERGLRCTMCFDMRFVKTARFAKMRGINVFTSSLGISRWKDMQQINGCGEAAASLIEDMCYWDFNWRKDGGGARMVELSKQEGFYQQEYCGCVYSLRDTNRWRKSRGREKINRGIKFYSSKDKDTKPTKRDQELDALIA